MPPVTKPLSRAVAALAFASVLAERPMQSAGFEESRAYCSDYGNEAVVFVGTPQSPVTFHVSGEAAIETARKELARVEAEVARLSAEEPNASLERRLEWRVRIVQAGTELEMH